MYSDWLQWALQQIPNPSLLAQMFGLSNIVRNSDPLKPIAIKREIKVEHGYIEKSGRVDVILAQSNRVLAVIELKTRPFSDGDLEKHAGSEFRRQVSVKMMDVLGEFATRLSDLGLPITGLKLIMRPGLDDVKLSEDCASIKLESNLNGITINYHVLWEANRTGALDVKLGVFIWTDLQVRIPVMWARKAPQAVCCASKGKGGTEEDQSESGQKRAFAPIAQVQSGPLLQG